MVTGPGTHEPLPNQHPLSPPDSTYFPRSLRKPRRPSSRPPRRRPRPPAPEVRNLRPRRPCRRRSIRVRKRNESSVCLLSVVSRTFDEQVERAIRERFAIPEEQQRPDGSWLDIEMRSENGDDEPGHTGLADCRREDRLATDSQGTRHTCGVSAPTSSTAPTPSRSRPLVFAAAEPELGSDRGSPPTSPGSSERRSSRTTRLAWPGSWTYSDSQRPIGRQLQHPVRAARLCKPRARPAPRSSRRSGRWLAHTGRRARSRTEAGPILPNRVPRPRA